ncbi:MAG: mechanosensitive ion channel family protein [Bryobacterales bacterium]
MLVDNVYRYTVLGFGIIMAADQIGVNVGAALAGIGVVGIAVGFAAQDTLSNIIAGFLIFLDKPFMVGDWLHVADQVGEVSEITMRTTRIRTKNNTWVVIPNKKIIDEVLVNHSKHGETRLDVPIGIAYKENIPQAREVLLRAVHGLEGVVNHPEPQVVVTGLGASSVDLEVRVWISVASSEPPLYAKVLEVSKLALDEANIEIPFPHLQLFFDDVRPAVWNGLKENVQSIRTH